MKTKDRIKRYLVVSSMLALLLITTVISTYAVDIGASEADKLGINELWHYNGLIFGSFRAQQADAEGALAVGGNGEFGWSPNQGFDIGPAVNANNSYTFIGSYKNPKGYPALLMGGLPKVNGNDANQWIYYNIYGGPLVISEEHYSTYMSASKKFSMYSGHKVLEASSAAVEEFFTTAKEIAVGMTEALDNANDVYLTPARLKSASYIRDKWNNEKERMIPQNLDISGITDNVNIYVINIMEGDGHLNLGEMYLPRPGENDLIVINVPNVLSVNFTGGAIFGINTSGGSSMLQTMPPGWYPDLNKELAYYCDRYIWNFPDAQLISFSNYAMVGSVIAPYANVYGNGGSINGMLIAESFDSTNGCELHAFTLNKNIFKLKKPEEQEPTGSVKFTKYGVEKASEGQEMKTTLAGVGFDLKIKVGDTYEDYLTGLQTDAYGEIQIQELKSGEYRFVETEPLPGYKNCIPIDFEIIADSDNEEKVHVSLEAENELAVTNLILYKLKKDGTDPSEDGLSGAKFHLYKILDDGTVRLVGDVESKQNGKIELNNLTVGRYSLVEFQAPDGYEIDPMSRVWTIAVELDGSGKLTASLEGGGEQLYNIPQLPGEKNTIVVEIRKLDALSGDPVALDLLKDAEFYLYQYDSHDNEWNLTLGVSGGRYVNEEDDGTKKITFTEYGYMVELEEDGFYILQEKKSPPGYEGLTLGSSGGNLLEEDSVTEVYIWVPELTLGMSGKPEDIQDWPPDFPKEEFNRESNLFGYILVHNEKFSYTIYNQPSGKIIIDKTNGSGGLLQGVTFDLYRSAGRGYQWITSGKTGSDGILEFQNLSPGTYYVVESAAPDGYILDRIPHLAIITGKEDNNKPIEISVVNYEQDNTAKARAAFQKVDTDGTVIPGKALAGAEFDLYRYNSTKIMTDTVWEDTGTTLTVPETEATLLVTPWLNPGVYKLVESTPPLGYDNQTLFGDLEIIFPIITQPDNPLSDSISYLGVIEVENSKLSEETPDPGDETYGKIQMTKVDSEDTTLGLAGAEFTLCYTKNKESSPFSVIGVYTTDSNGIITLDELKPGDYIAYESKAPDNYELSDRLLVPLEFTVDYNGKIVFDWGVQTPNIPDPVDGVYFILVKNEKEYTEGSDKPDPPEPPTTPDGGTDGGRDKDPGTDKPDEYPNDRTPSEQQETPESPGQSEDEAVAIVPDQPLHPTDNPETGDMVTQIALILLAYLLSSAVIITYLYRMDESR